MKLIKFFMIFILGGCLGVFAFQENLHSQPLNPNILLSQNRHKSFTSDDGIENVLDIVQDDDGFLWLAAYTGLVRFDGEDFIHYNRATREDFPASAARCLLKDRQGRLWIGTNDGGLLRFHNDTFEVFNIENGLPSNSVRQLSEDADGGLWIGTASGAAYFDGTDFKRFASLDALSRKLVNFICQDSSGNIWIGMNQINGVYRLEKGADKFIPYQGSLSGLIQNTVLEFMIKDRSGDGLWAITSDSLIHMKNQKVLKVYDLNKEITASKKISNNKIYQDADGAIWLTGISGIIRFFEDSFELYSSADGLSEDIVFAAFQDREGNLWFGTRPGLEQFSRSKFTIYSQTEGLLDDTVNAVLEDKPGEFLAATNQGLNLILPRQRKIKTFSENLLKTRIRHLYKDHSGRVWVSTYGNGLLVLENRKIKRHFTTEDGLAANKIRLVLEDHQHNIWAGTRSGLSMIDQDGRITNYTTRTNHGLTNDFILSLYEDPEGRIWIGTDGGGIHTFEKGRITRTFSKSGGILGNVIFRFYPDSEGRIWVTTNNGISIIHNSEITNLTAKQGLLSNTVFEILADSHDRLWMTTPLGLFYAYKGDIEAVIKGEKNKFPIVVFDKHAEFKKNPTANAWTETDSDGNFWMPTYGGAAVINPNKIPMNERPPQAVILSSNIETLYTKKKKDALVIPPDTPRVNFHFTVLSFMSPEKNLLQFKLEGFDKEWSAPGKKRDVSYTNLSPGSYVFKVKGMNNDGIPSRNEATLRFLKSPHYYETVWFLILMIISGISLVALMGAGIYRYRVKQLNEKLERQKYQIELERKATEAERKSKEQVIELSESYSRFVPHIFLNFLGKKSILDVGLGDQIEKEMSILFADIRDFTSISEGLSPKKIFDFINAYLSRMEPIVHQFDGYIDKYMGDGIMALFPSAEQALNAAIGMNNTLNIHNQSRIKKHQKPIQIGIGINTGNLMLGTVGGKHRMDGTVLSDAVNLASRIEGLTKYYGANILVAEDTYSKLPDPDQYHVRVVDKVAVKGKTEAVTVFEALDGLPEEIKALKIKFKSDFEKAYTHYRHGALDRAKEIFQKCLLKCPEDAALEIYIRRCEEYLKMGIGENWDGVSHLDFK